MMPRRPGRQFDEGFTLTEMLIVVAIIALLVTMLMPSLGRAHARALLVDCQNNLHTVGVGIQGYLNSHEALPVSQHVDNPHPDLMAKIAGAYVKPEAFYCPAETRNDLCFSDRNVQAGNITYFYYCSRNGPANHDASQFLWRHGITNVKWPRAITSAGVKGIDDWQTDPWILSDRWVSGERPHPFGQKGLNFLRLGGAVKMVGGSPRDEFK